ncbi:minor tail protein [Microbacterium phage Huwbert]|nr:minor tail protein [Microbacterium phage Huwbert]
MGNNTDTYWEANGQSLHTFARSIESLSGLGPPPMRGDNEVIPLMPGAQYVPKVADQNILTLGMWARGIKPLVTLRENLNVNPKPTTPSGYSGPGTASVNADGVTITHTSATTPYIFSSFAKGGAVAGRVYAIRAKIKGVPAAGSTATNYNIRPHKRTGNAYYNPTQGAISVPMDGVQREVAFYWKATVDISEAEGFDLTMVGNGTAAIGSTSSMDEVLMEDVGTEIPMINGVTIPPEAFFYGGSTPPNSSIIYSWSGLAGASSSIMGVDNVAGAPSKDQFQTNWNDIIRLLWNNGRQFKLTKRFYDNSQNPIAASAMAEYSGGLKPTMIGPKAGKFTVDLKLADPFFYADVLQTLTLVNGDNIINVPGNAPTLNVLITINGARTNTRILNKTNNFQFTYPNAVLANEYLRVVNMTYDAFHKPAAAPEYDASTRIIHQGGYQWMQLEPGQNVIHVQSTSGAGTIQLQTRGAWV